MKYPNLIPASLCKVPVTVILHQEGLTEEGAPIKAFKDRFLCVCQSGIRTVQEADRKQVRLSGTVWIPGDICPGLSELSGGRVRIFGSVRRIAGGTKARNPDGTVNYTRLELM